MGGKNTTFARCEFHELMLSENDGLQQGSIDRNVAYIRLVEMDISGLAETGDEVLARELRLRTLAGFDLNHYIQITSTSVLSAVSAMTDAELALQLGTQIMFRADPCATRPT